MFAYSPRKPPSRRAAKLVAEGKRRGPWEAWTVSRRFADDEVKPKRIRVLRFLTTFVGVFPRTVGIVDYMKTFPSGCRRRNMTLRHYHLILG